MHVKVRCFLFGLVDIKRKNLYSIGNIKFVVKRCWRNDMSCECVLVHMNFSTYFFMIDDKTGKCASSSVINYTCAVSKVGMCIRKNVLGVSSRASNLFNETCYLGWSSEPRNPFQVISRQPRCRSYV